jgi:hypothetical protein
LENSILEVRRAFGFFFIAVAIAVAAGAVASEVAYSDGLGVVYQAVMWLASFGVTFGVAAGRFRKVFPSIRSRMKNSIGWPTTAKVINGICWAGPFAAIGLFPYLYQYLILLGIGLGNLSTYLLMKKHSGLDNREQAIVGIISLVSIPVAVGIDHIVVSNQSVLVTLSRILISVAYAVGGIFALHAKR